MRAWFAEHPAKYILSVIIIRVVCVGSMAGQAASTPAPSQPVPAHIQTDTKSPIQSEAQAEAKTAKPGDVSSGSLKPKIVEDWSTPSLQGSQLELQWDMIGASYEGPAFTREITRVQWRSGDPVDLYIIKPVGVKKPPVILYMYSFPYETDRFTNDAFCRAITRNGFAAVGFATALTGQRYHGRGFKHWFVSELQESLATSAHDVQMILNYMDKRGDMDTQRLGIFGDGSGASIAILAAAVDDRIKTLDLLDPWGDWPEWLAKSTRIPEDERAGFLKPEFLAGVAPLDPVQWLPKLKTQKIRIQDVKTVTVTPDEAKQKIEAAAPPNAQIVRYDSHQAFMSAQKGGIAFDWIKEQLQPGSTSQYQATQEPQPSKGSQAAAKPATQ